VSAGSTKWGISLLKIRQGQVSTLAITNASNLKFKESGLSIPATMIGGKTIILKQSRSSPNSLPLRC
jgi:hypothetical protein